MLPRLPQLRAYFLHAWSLGKRKINRLGGPGSGFWKLGLFMSAAKFCAGSENFTNGQLATGSLVQLYYGYENCRFNS